MFRKDKGLTKAAFAEKLGVPQNTYSRHTKAEDNEKLSRLLWRITDTWPEVSRNWIFFNEGEMYEARGAETPPAPPVDVNLLQKAIEPIEKFLHAKKQVLSPADKAKLFAQCYALLLEQNGHDNLMQRIQQIMDALMKDPV